MGVAVPNVVIKAKVQKASNMELRDAGTWRYYWDVACSDGLQYLLQGPETLGGSEWSTTNAYKA